MRNKVRFAALFLTTGALFAQHGAGLRGSSSVAPSHATSSVSARSVVRANAGLSRHSAGRRGYGNGYLAPYYPFFGDYGDQLLPGADYPPPGDDTFVPPSAPAFVQPSPQPPIAHSVIRNYNWNGQTVAAAGEKPTFTIALKDGSTRSAVATWVQGRTLHYTDSEDNQGVLSSDLIDRVTTRQLNKEQRLTIQLPPG